MKVVLALMAALVSSSMLISWNDPDDCGTDWTREIMEQQARKSLWEHHQRLVENNEMLLRRNLKKWQEYSDYLAQFLPSASSQYRQVAEKMATYYNETLNTLIMKQSTQTISEMKPAEPIPVQPAPQPAPIQVKEVRKEVSKYERMEKLTYIFMSSALKIIQNTQEQFSGSLVDWNEVSEAINTLNQSYTKMMEMQQKELDVKTVFQKLFKCLQSGNTDFQSLASINEELWKLKASISHSEINKISSKWSSDFLMRIDATLKKELTSSSTLSEHSRTVQRRFVELKNRSETFNSIISWSIMRSEEVLKSIETTAKVDMESVTSIIKAAMKITDKLPKETAPWLNNVNDALKKPDLWTSPPADFWKNASLDDIEKQRGAPTVVAPVTPAPPVNPPASPKKPAETPNRIPYIQKHYSPQGPNGPTDPKGAPLDGSKSPCPDCDADRDVIDVAKIPK